MQVYVFAHNNDELMLFAVNKTNFQNSVNNVIFFYNYVLM